MAMIGGGMIGPTSGAKSLTFKDTLGVDTFELKDSDGFSVFKVDSKGNLYIRGEVKKI